MFRGVRQKREIVLMHCTMFDIRCLIDLSVLYGIQNTAGFYVKCIINKN